MTIYSIPSNVGPNTIEWGLVSNTRTFSSPETGDTQTKELPGAKWKATLNFRNLNDTRTRALKAFLTRLRGQVGQFYLKDYSYIGAAGVATGTPVVSGASQTGATINTTGWTVSTPGILLAGDLINVGTELKIVVVDADSDVSGNSTITIEPPIRTSPSDASPIVITNPTAIMRLEENTIMWITRPGQFTDCSFSCIEAF